VYGSAVMKHKDTHAAAGLLIRLKIDNHTMDGGPGDAMDETPG
jgi:hypothetical protein